MKAYQDMDKDELLHLYKSLNEQYIDIQNQHLQLNMARGKPDTHQLHLSLEVLDMINSHYNFNNHLDYLNYGLMEGIDEAKVFFAAMLDTHKDNIIVYGNSSLTIMFDQISRGYTHGYLGEKPWCQLDKVKFLCPVPGYDRHFKITEHFNIEMINIPMNEFGPDMNLIEEYIKDEAVKGIWCVPQYANPSGISYSDDVVKRFAHLKPAAKDFRIFWDNAYLVHHLYEDKQDHILNILTECEKAHNPNLVFEFCSTSKITIPGSGVAALATSIENKKDIVKHMAIQCISHDKINQLRHVEYFKHVESLEEHMKKQAQLLRPKFEIVHQTLEKELQGLNIGKWTNPLGGYFVCFDSLNGCAKDIVKKCKEAGLTLTAAGAPFPYGKDPDDKTIRIAPSFPHIEELQQAMNLFTLCVKLVSIEKML